MLSNDNMLGPTWHNINEYMSGNRLGELYVSFEWYLLTDLDTTLKCGTLRGGPETLTTGYFLETYDCFQVLNGLTYNAS